MMSNQQSSPGTSSPPIPLPWGQQHPCPSHQAQAQHSPGFHSSNFIQQNATLRAGQGGKKEREQRSDAHILSSRPGPEHQEGQEPTAPARVTALSGWESRDKPSAPASPQQEMTSAK